MLLSKLLSKKDLTLDALPDYGFKLMPELSKTRPVIMGTFKVNVGDYLGIMVNTTAHGSMSLVNLNNLTLKIHHNSGEGVCNITVAGFKVEEKLFNHPLLKFSGHTITHNFNRLLTESVGKHIPLYRDLSKDIHKLTKLQYFRDKYFGEKLVLSVYGGLGFKDNTIPVGRVYLTHIMEAILAENGILDLSECFETLYRDYNHEMTFIWSQDHNRIRHQEDNNPGTVLYDTLKVRKGMRIIEIPNVRTIKEPLWYLPTDNILMNDYYLTGVSAEELSPMVQDIYRTLYSYGHLRFEGRIQTMEGFLMFQTIKRLAGKHLGKVKVDIIKVSKSNPLPNQYCPPIKSRRQILISISM